MDQYREAITKHEEWRGKLEIMARAQVSDNKSLSLAYTPGVAGPCLEIAKNPERSYDLTRRWNLVGVITDGTAVLGLGDIGPEAGMPVMEGKCVLFKQFAGVDAFPLCIRSKDVDEIVRTVSLLAGSFGGINLEDIAAPRCFEIERRLKEVCDIPVFHDDQHGTAVVVAAALINALQIVHKKLDDIHLVINGAGAAGIAIARHLLKLGIKDITMVDRFGIVCEGMVELNGAQAQIAKLTNREKRMGRLNDALAGADVFIGVSVPGVLKKEMIASMNRGAIVFAMANPVPEIGPEEALAAGAAVVGTGRSDYNNQINNVLAFPGIFRGALNVRAREINGDMLAAASRAIASLVSKEKLKPDYIIPLPYDKRVGVLVAEAVSKAAIASGVARKTG